MNSGITPGPIGPDASAIQKEAEHVDAPSRAYAMTTASKLRPRLGCAGIVQKGETVLLGRRNKEPNRGLWVLPGGGVKYGETFSETFSRELMEETGTYAQINGIFKVYELIKPPEEHRVIVYLKADYRSGELRASSDLSEVRFFGKEELQNMAAHGGISPFVVNVLQDAELL